MAPGESHAGVGGILAVLTQREPPACGSPSIRFRSIVLDSPLQGRGYGWRWRRFDEALYDRAAGQLASFPLSEEECACPKIQGIGRSPVLRDIATKLPSELWRAPGEGPSQASPRLLKVHPKGGRR